MASQKLTKEEFITRASAFLADRLGEGAGFDTDTDLVASGLLDSLLMVEFFFFIEELRGTPINTEGFNLKQISTIQQAYQLATVD